VALKNPLIPKHHERQRRDLIEKTLSQMVEIRKSRFEKLIKADTTNHTSGWAQKRNEAYEAAVQDPTSKIAADQAHIVK
jgi:hypothetical protein